MSKTPTGYGVIRVSARKQIVVPSVNVPSKVHPLRSGSATSRTAGQAPAGGRDVTSGGPAIAR